MPPWLWAEATAPASPWSDLIGPYGALIGAVISIGWLIKDRARVIAQRDALFAQVLESEARTSEQVGKLGPIIEANTRALDHARGQAR